MKGFLLDTNVLSELRRPKPNATVLAFIAEQQEDALWVSEVTFAEIRFGIEQAPSVDRRADLTSWLSNTLRPLFAGRVLPVGEDVLLRWRSMLEAGRKRRHTFPQPDLLIAATAAESRLVVATRDTDPFVTAAVPVFDPWSGQFVAADGLGQQVVEGGARNLLE